MNLASPTNATIVDGHGVGTITDDDPLPALSVNDVTVSEGNAGTANATFTVTLAPVSGRTVTVDYATEDGTATAPADYIAATGTLTFLPGQTSRTVSVAVRGDLLDEINETYVVNLSNPGSCNSRRRGGRRDDHRRRRHAVALDQRRDRDRRTERHRQCQLRGRLVRAQRADGERRLRNRGRLGDGWKRLRRHRRKPRLQSGRHDEDACRSR